MKDFHKGLKVGQQQLGRSAAFGVEFLAIEHQWGKADFEYSIHAFPSQFGPSGLQTTDLLALLGFRLRNCAFRNGQQCYSIEVRPGLDLSRFPNAFDAAYGVLSEAERHLNNCGFQLPQPEVGILHWSDGTAGGVTASFGGWALRCPYRGTQPQ